MLSRPPRATTRVPSKPAVPFNYELVRVPDRIDTMHRSADFIREAAARALAKVDALARSSEDELLETLRTMGKPTDAKALEYEAALLLTHGRKPAGSDQSKADKAELNVDSKAENPDEERMYLTLADVKHIIAVNGYDKL